MALIKCPECGKEISNKSKQCIHCGYPLDEFQQNNTNQLYKIVLTDYGKNKVRLRLRDKITVFDGAHIIVIQSLSVKLPGTDRLD